jgi:hypothetical protein
MQTESVQGGFVRRGRRLASDWPVAKAQQAVSLALSVGPDSLPGDLDWAAANMEGILARVKRMIPAR